MDIATLAISEQEVLHEIKKWIPDLLIAETEDLALKDKEKLDNF